MSVVVGIDPGQTGALALIMDGEPHIYDYPNDERGVADLIDTISLVTSVDLCAIEQQSARPGQGVVSMFKIGQNFGVWLGAVAMSGWPVRLVRPQVWQVGLVPNAGGKEASLATARRMFPDAPLKLKKHHGRADALLIAYWASKQVK